ncbi:MAG: hypothetical protein WC667_07725 [Sulfurimonas sp.]|jgi:hypothetical protein
MIKTALLILTTFLFTACFNKHGVSAKYYSDCEEYYDMQGYYHKECGKDDIATYKEMGEGAGKAVDSTYKTASDVGEAVYDYIK